MARLPSPARHSSTEARPVDSSERLILLDVLRGFALCGVFVANSYVYFSGRAYLPKERAEALMSSPVDGVAHHLFEHLVSGKAMALFSFLFGLGFAIQMDRAEERGASIVSVYTRRLGVLLLLGLTHLFVLWHGDVLWTYASMGFVLLLFRKLPDRRLLLWGLVLILGAPLVISALQKLVPLLASSPEVVREEARVAMARVAGIRSRTLEAFASDSYLAGVRANADFYLGFFLVRPVFVSYLLIALGRFLLGLVAGRRRLFHDVGQHLPFFRRLLGWSLVAGVLGNIAGALIPYLWSREVLARGTSWTLFRQFMADVGVLGLAAFYVAGLSLLFQRERWRRFLSVLAPAGQMALTNYLGQSVLGLLLFRGYGLGLIGKLGSASCLALIFGLFWVQVLVSHLWLARFRFGPAEWLWRSLTYGQLQPMRRARAEERAARTSAKAG
jgi:uncharacterized protein